MATLFVLRFLYLISFPLCQACFFRLQCERNTFSLIPISHSLQDPLTLVVLSCLIMSFLALLITFYPLSAAGFIAHSFLLLFAVAVAVAGFIYPNPCTLYPMPSCPPPQTLGVTNDVVDHGVCLVSSQNPQRGPHPQRRAA